MSRSFGSATSQLGIVVDLDLRPREARLMSRTIACTSEYAQRWASTWEYVVAVRARPIGSSDPMMPAPCLNPWPTGWEVRDTDCSRPAWKTSVRRAAASLPGTSSFFGPGGLRRRVDDSAYSDAPRCAPPALRTPPRRKPLRVARDADCWPRPTCRDSPSERAWDLATRIRAGEAAHENEPRLAAA